jgi:hypothetical protein
MILVIWKMREEEEAQVDATAGIASGQSQVGYNTVERLMSVPIE